VQGQSRLTTSRVESTSVGTSAKVVAFLVFLLSDCAVTYAANLPAAEAFKQHPHLTIPQSSIQVMEVQPMGSRG